MSEAAQERHARFLDAYYGRVKHIYDLSRRFFLLGRDRVLREILTLQWDVLLEVGCGTGRNLAWLHARAPQRRYRGLDASSQMLRLAHDRYPWADLRHGFAEDARSLTGERPDIVLFSYSLSMMQDQRSALLAALDLVRPGGHVYVIDFSRSSGIPRVLRRAFTSFLAAFHVTPMEVGLFESLPCTVELRRGRLDYYLVAILSRAGPQ